MTERYPSDSSLLAQTEDEATGLEYIPTGKSPYFLEFRRLVHRLLVASQRANDLRVYQEGDLSIGLRGGRCFIGENAHQVLPQEQIAVTPDSTVRCWIDASGVFQTGADFPADRSTYIPLAEVESSSASIDSITDLRGEAFLQSPSAALLGLTASGDEINQALDGIDATVTAAALNTLTGGPYSIANNQHTHTVLGTSQAGIAHFGLSNHSTDPDANVALRFSSPERFFLDTFLTVNPENNFLQQQYAGTSYNLIGVLPISSHHDGELLQNVTDRLVGMAPISGEVVQVTLSCANNLQSTEAADGVACKVYKNGQPLLSTDAEIRSSDGAGFRSTAQGDGVAAQIVTSGEQSVLRGDLLTFDLNRNVSGGISEQMADVAVSVLIKADGPA